MFLNYKISRLALGYRRSSQFALFPNFKIWIPNFSIKIQFSSSYYRGAVREFLDSLSDGMMVF